jgi:hypothetical protein
MKVLREAAFFITSNSILNIFSQNKIVSFEKFVYFVIKIAKSTCYLLVGRFLFSLPKAAKLPSRVRRVGNPHFSYLKPFPEEIRLEKNISITRLFKIGAKLVLKQRNKT